MDRWIASGFPDSSILISQSANSALGTGSLGHDARKRAASGNSSETARDPPIRLPAKDSQPPVFPRRRRRRPLPP
jgi:hypothetical protein